MQRNEMTNQCLGVSRSGVGLAHIFLTLGRCSFPEERKGEEHNCICYFIGRSVIPMCCYLCVSSLLLNGWLTSLSSEP